MKLWMRIVFIFIGFFESLTITGIIFGWPALLHVFQIEGIYSHLCLEEDAQNGNGTAQIAANTSVTTVIVRITRINIDVKMQIHVHTIRKLVLNHYCRENIFVYRHW